MRQTVMMVYVLENGKYNDVEMFVDKDLRDVEEKYGKLDFVFDEREDAGAVEKAKQEMTVPTGDGHGVFVLIT